MACTFSGSKRRTGAQIRSAMVSGIVTGDAPVSYWPILSLSLETGRMEKLESGIRNPEPEPETEPEPEPEK